MTLATIATPTFKLNTLFIHAVAWVCVLFFPFIFFSLRIQHAAFLLKIVINVSFFIAFFYLHLLVILPRYLKDRKLWRYVLSVLLIILVIVGEEFASNQLVPARLQAVMMMKSPVNGTVLPRLAPISGGTANWGPPPGNAGFFSIFRIIERVSFTSLLILSVSGILKITSEWAKNERRNREMENDKLSSELTFLKSQVNPHFLFNTLNNIYSLAYRKSDDTPTAIVKLSQLMRYMLYESNDRLVGLAREVEYLKNYIDLQRMRFSDTVQIAFSTAGDIDDKMIEPMLFIHFVENAFKFAANHTSEPIIRIWLQSESDHLYFKVENNFDLSDPLHTQPGNSGIGLQNVTRRLALLYPDRHQLIINRHEQARMYTVELTLNFQS